jgi:hypothetical protein
MVSAVGQTGKDRHARASGAAENLRSPEDHCRVRQSHSESGESRVLLGRSPQISRLAPGTNPQPDMGRLAIPERRLLRRFRRRNVLRPSSRGGRQYDLSRRASERWRSPGAPPAIAARSPGTLVDTPDRLLPSAGGNRCGAAVGRLNRCMRPEQAGTWMAETNAGNTGRPVATPAHLAGLGRPAEMFDASSAVFTRYIEHASHDPFVRIIG